MKRGVRKFALLLSLFLLSAIVAGCISQKEATTPTSPSPTSSPTSPTQTQQKTVEVIVYGQWGGVEGQNFQNALKQYEKEHPNVKIKYVIQSKLRDAVLTELATGSPGFDIAILPWPALIKELGEKGQLEPLNSVVDAYKGEIMENLLEPVKSGNTYYGVPIKAWAKPGIWYNVHVFKNNNLEPPKTLDELKQVCDVLKSKGIQPMASGAADKWPLSDIFEAVLIRVGGPELHQKLMKHEVKWTDPQVVEAFKILSDLLKQGCYGDPKVAIGEKWEAQVARLGKGEVAMYFMGNWINLMLQKEGYKPGVDYDLIPFPEINPNVDFAIVAGGDWIIIPKNAPHKEAALELAKWFAGPEYQKIMVEQKGYLAPNLKVPKSAYDPVDAKIIDMMAKYTVVPDLDDNVPSGFQPVIWNKLFELWANPDNYKQIAQELEQAAQQYYKS
ncbi:extracellular solute-binding protein [Thermococcus sp. SY098]|uniref:ABC transporter substrate-binding protein n=1 Tax=Thermococcus sp. SY098 TaxID=3111325 RepID=UPI002D788890|nr:extracellular solute-binding protein [Thermococcus sp. SY098]WRS52020.1 extracellular solute-binding protein [Thermococcus sp. SY098]